MPHSVSSQPSVRFGLCQKVTFDNTHAPHYPLNDESKYNIGNILALDTYQQTGNKAAVAKYGDDFYYLEDDAQEKPASKYWSHPCATSEDPSMTDALGAEVTKTLQPPARKIEVWKLREAVETGRYTLTHEQLRPHMDALHVFLWA